MEVIQRWISDFLNILTRGQPFGWNNVLDVLIVAVFIYYVLLLIRGTRAVQLLIGVMVLVLIYFVATSLHLTLTTLLLQALFAVALVALVVVFQPELQVCDEGRALLFADRETFLGGQAIDVTLDGEEGVDALDRLECDRRDHRRLPAALGGSGDVGELEEAASCMRPAECRRDRAWGA